MKRFSRQYRLISIGIALLTAVSLAVLPAAQALAVPLFCPDGTPANDNIVCSDGSNTDIGLDAGDDIFKMTDTGSATTVAGDALPDGTDLTGNGGNDSITINGEADYVYGDSVTNNGGDDTIIINGWAGYVYGDFAGWDGGNDNITINGEADFVYGDSNSENFGGNDTITLGDGAYVQFSVYGEAGDDTVIIGKNAEVGGSINGGNGFDTLKFTGIPQSALEGKDPSADNVTYGGYTYTWFTFEQLLGYIIKNQNNPPAISCCSVVNLGAADSSGISVLLGSGKIAFIPFASLVGQNTGKANGLKFQVPNTGGWYVLVVNLGPSQKNPGQNDYQILVYDGDKAMMCDTQRFSH